MNKRRLLSLAGLTILLGTFGISRSVAYVGATIAGYQHAVPCGRLSGFAGLLQATHFLATGNCAVSPSGACQTSGKACSTSSKPVSGASQNGTCTSTATTCYC